MTLSAKQTGFTIVELLIVIVVIGILAAITIVSFNGVQQRATSAAVQADLAQNAKAVIAANATSSVGQFSTIAAMPGGEANLKFNIDKYKVVTYCSDATNFVLAVKTTTGDVYYSKTGGAMVKDNAVDAFLPCNSLGLSVSQTTYLNLPAQCSGETAPCTFSGSVTIAYGSAAQGRFTRVVNPTSPVTCTHNSTGFNIGDPAPGFQKACYVYPN